MQDNFTINEIMDEFGQPSAFRGLSALCLTWLGIFCTIKIAAIINHWLIIPLALTILGGFQHRLFTLYHDAFHSSLLPNRQLNDFVGAWFAAYPALSRYTGPKIRHLLHHSATATLEDPEHASHLKTWQELTPLLFFWPFTVMRKLFGRAPWDNEFKIAMEGHKVYKTKPSYKELLYVLISQLMIIGLGFLFQVHFWILLHITTLIIITPALQGLRQWVEHYQTSQEKKLKVSPRYIYIKSNWLERFYLAPMNFNYHAAHHYYPRVPFFQLPALLGKLKKANIPFVERPSYISQLKSLPWRSKKECLLTTH